MKQTLVWAIFAAALLAVWQGAVSAGLWSPVILPGPVSVGAYLAGALGDGTLLSAAGVTLLRLLTGYAAGIAIGLPLGLMTARFPSVHQTLGLLAMGLQALPSVCWVPLALLWFGQTEAAMLFIVVMGTVWSMLIATDNGVRSVPPLYTRAARTMGSRRLHTWLSVVLPASLPHHITGMKQSWAFAWRSLMAAELFVTILTGFGLGHLLHYGRELIAMDQVIGVMIVIIVIGLVADRLLFSPIERSVRRRWGLSG
jgi:NitT/TauT family transport system permease protein